MVSVDKNNINDRIKQPFNKTCLLFVLGEIVALGILVAYVSSFFSFSDSIDIISGFTVTYLVPRLIYSKSKLSCQWGRWMLLAVSLTLAIYTIYSIKVCALKPDFSLEMPDLNNDDGSYYCWALSHYDGRCPAPNILYKGLPLFMLGLWKILGVSIVWPLALNYMFTLLTIVVTGKTAHRMLSHHFPTTTPSTIAATAMLMVSLLGFLMSQGVRVQKEASCALSMALVGYSLAGMSITTLSKRERRLDSALFMVGTLLMALVRTNFVYFIVLGAAIMAMANKRAQWKRCTTLAIVALILTFIFNYLFAYTLEHQFLIINGGDTMAHDFKIGTVQQPYLLIIGDYYYFPKWERVLLMPMTAGVQFIIPFPWLYDYLSADALTILPRIRLMWYIVGGTCIFYYLYISVIHYKRSNMGMWAWWPLVTFVLISFVTGGLVSRYALPLQPLFVVVALYVMLHVKEGRYRRSFIIWMIVYTLILIATLIFCYHTQVEYLKSLHTLN